MDLLESNRKSLVTSMEESMSTGEINYICGTMNSPIPIIWEASSNYNKVVWG